MNQAGDDGGRDEGGTGAESSAALAPKQPTSVPAAASRGAVQSKETTDVLYLHSACESGQGYNVIRQRSNRIEVGELRTAKEGQPFVGELVKLTPRAGQERLFDVEVLVDASAGHAQRQGPAKVSSAAYRENWDHIFGSSSKAPVDGGEQLN